MGRTVSEPENQLSLKIADQNITFNSLAEFEFALSGRTDVPSRKIAELVALTPAELKSEAQSIKAVEQMFVDVLAKSIDEPGSVSQLLRDIDVHVFSQDHNWRDLMRSLNDKDETYDDLRRIALVKYMQYLRSRQDIIKQTYAVKKQEASGQSGDAPASRPVDGEPPGVKDTVIFDTAVMEVDSDATRDFSRIPKGEAIHLNLGENEILPIRLSKHPFRLVRDEGFRMVDDQERSHELQFGKNIVGRDSVCNVVLDSDYRDVSRVHLMLELSDENRLRLTDLSSHGTYIPRRFFHIPE